MRAEFLELMADIFVNVLEREEKRRSDGGGAGEVLDACPQVLLGGVHQAAIGVVDDHELLRAEKIMRHEKRTKAVVGNDASSVADDVRIASAQAERTNGKSRIHASEHSKFALGSWREPAELVCPRVFLIGFENVVDDGHGANSLAGAPLQRAPIGT